MCYRPKDDATNMAEHNAILHPKEIKVKTADEKKDEKMKKDTEMIQNMGGSSASSMAKAADAEHAKGAAQAAADAKKKRSLQKAKAPVILNKIVDGDNTPEKGPAVNIQGWTLVEDPKGVDAMKFVRSGYHNPEIQSGIISKVAFLTVLALSFLLN